VIIGALCGLDVPAKAGTAAPTREPVPRVRIDPDCVEPAEPPPPSPTEVPPTDPDPVVESAFSLMAARVRVDDDLALLGAPELSITVGGTGFEPRTTVVFRFGPEEGGSVEVGGSTRVGGLGVFEATITVRWPTSRGQYVVTAETRGEGPSGQASFDVPCEPSIEATICDGDLDETRIRVTGRGFARNGRVVLLHEDPGRYDPIVLGEPPTDRRGTFTFEGRFEAIGDGTHRIMAVVGERVRAQTYVETPCPVPNVTLEPTCGPAGPPEERMELIVTGTGFHDDTSALVVWDGRRSGETWVIQIDDDGSFTVSIWPRRRARGTYQVTVENDPGRRARRVARDRFEVPCPPLDQPSIRTRPRCDVPLLQGQDPRRHEIVVQGSDFLAGPVTITFRGEGSARSQTFPREVRSDGSFRTEIDPDAGPAGRYRIAARQELSVEQQEALATSTRVLEAETQFETPCEAREPTQPTLDPVCRPVFVGERDPDRIRVTGSGLYEDATVVVLFGRGRGVREFEARADDDGAFEALIPFPPPEDGRYPVRAVQRDGADAEVARSPAATFTVPCPLHPRLEIEPSSGPPGYTTRVEGTGFGPGTTVTLTWSRGIDSRDPVEVEVGADGEFTVRILILPHDFIGERTLTAGLRGEPDAYPDATARYVVTTGSGLPPGPGGSGYVYRR
jgi:hypothetical protein